MSQSREDYIKFIYEHGETRLVSNKELSKGLNVSAPSVSEMVGKLAEEGLLSYVPYQGVKLTQIGVKKAQTLIRKHEIWEYFLSQKLGYSPLEVHELAEVLEHVTPDDLADRLAAFIEYVEKE